MNIKPNTQINETTEKKTRLKSFWKEENEEKTQTSRRRKMSKSEIELILSGFRARVQVWTLLWSHISYILCTVWVRVKQNKTNMKSKKKSNENSKIATTTITTIQWNTSSWKNFRKFRLSYFRHSRIQLENYIHLSGFHQKPMSKLFSKLLSCLQISS